MTTPLDATLDQIKKRRSLPPPATRRHLRMEAGLTQLDFARELGVTVPAVSRWETTARGRARNPRDPGLVERYAALLRRLANDSLQ